MGGGVHTTLCCSDPNRVVRLLHRDPSYAPAQSAFARRVVLPVLLVARRRYRNSTVTRRWDLAIENINAGIHHKIGSTIVIVNHKKFINYSQILEK